MEVGDGQFVAKARVIMQGFKHKDVVTGEVNKESPTLSSLGRFVMFLILAMNNWKFFTANIKSAFLQADDIVDTVGLRIFGVPNGDMRRRLQRLMGLKPGQVRRMRKPAFGDVLAPNLWNKKADGTMGELGFWTHGLDPCLLPFRTRVYR